MWYWCDIICLTPWGNINVHKFHVNVSLILWLLTTDIIRKAHQAKASRDLRDVNHERKRDTCVACWALRKNPFDLWYLCSDKNSAASRSAHRGAEAQSAVGAIPNRAVRKSRYIMEFIVIWGLKDRHLLYINVSSTNFMDASPMLVLYRKLMRY